MKATPPGHARGEDPRLVAGQRRLSVGAGHRGEMTDLNPTDRAKPDTKYHLLTDRNGLPLHVLALAVNTHDSRLFEPSLETNPSVSGRPGRPRRHPEKLHADKGFRIPEVPALSAPPGHQGPCYPPRNRGLDPPGPAPLGCRTHHFLDAALQAPRAARRPHRSHRDGTDHDRLGGGCPCRGAECGTARPDTHRSGLTHDSAR